MMKRCIPPLLGIGILLVMVVGSFYLLTGHRTVARADSPVPSLKVQGNQLIDTTRGVPVVLHGVDRMGSEYNCPWSGSTIFDGSVNNTTIDAMLSWHINIVRLPLNEDCWLGINGAMDAQTYQTAIKDYVTRLNAHGIVVIADLHWNSPGGSNKADGQQVMADEDHAPAFWQGVASIFKGNNSVIFDLYNEPDNKSQSMNWKCLRDGGSSCSGDSFQVAGMQQLVDTVRSTGATNVIMVGGLGWSGDLSQWLNYKPNDPLNNIAASWHAYGNGACNGDDCEKFWDGLVGPVAQSVPVIAGEIGDFSCGSDYLNHLMNWLDAHNATYLAWAWHPGGCSLNMITDYASGTPTDYGKTYHDHLINLPAEPTGTPLCGTVTPTGTPDDGTVTPTGTPNSGTIAPTVTPTGGTMIPMGIPDSGTVTSTEMPNNGTMTPTTAVPVCSTVTPTNSVCGTVTETGTSDDDTIIPAGTPDNRTTTPLIAPVCDIGTPTGTSGSGTMIPTATPDSGTR